MSIQSISESILLKCGNIKAVLSQWYKIRDKHVGCSGKWKSSPACYKQNEWEVNGINIWAPLKLLNLTLKSRLILTILDLNFHELKKILDALLSLDTFCLHNHPPVFSLWYWSYFYFFSHILVIRQSSSTILKSKYTHWVLCRIHWLLCHIGSILRNWVPTM